MSILPPASMAFQSNLDVIANDQRGYRRQCQRKSNRSATSPAGVDFPAPIAPRPFTALLLEAVFAKVLDALIFTSALAITAYNYWTGELANTATPVTAAAAPTTIKTGSSYHYYHGCNSLDAAGVRVLDIRHWRQPHPRRLSSPPPMDRMQDRVLLEDSKRRRTLQWAESVAQTTATATEEPLIVATSSSTHSNSDNSIRSTHRQRRLRALSHPIMATATTAAPVEDGSSSNTIQENGKEDEMLARMEEQLQSLIEQGQAALTSRVVDMEAMDESEMVMRKSLASGEGGSASRPT